MSGCNLETPFTTTRRSASGNENPLRRTPFTAVKIDVVAPVPSAIVRVARIAKPGFFRRARALYRKSLKDMFLQNSAMKMSIFSIVERKTDEHIAHTFRNQTSCHSVYLSTSYLNKCQFHRTKICYHVVRQQ